MENENLIKKLPFGPRGIYIIRSSESIVKKRRKKKKKKRKQSKKKKGKFLFFFFFFFFNTRYDIGLIGSKFIRLGNGTV